MNRRCFPALTCAIVVTLFAGLCAVDTGAATPEPLLKVGFAERDITPELGMEHSGGYGKGPLYQTIHDPCKVRASVFDDGKQRVALVGVDAGDVRRPMVEAVRKQYTKDVAFPPRRFSSERRIRIRPAQPVSYCRASMTTARRW